MCVCVGGGGGEFGDLSQDIFWRTPWGVPLKPLLGSWGTHNRGWMGPLRLPINQKWVWRGGSHSTRGKVPPGANFVKTWQRTLLYDLAGGRSPQYEMIQNTKGKHHEKLLHQEQNPEGQVRPPPPHSLRRGLSALPPIKGFSGGVEIDPSALYSQHLLVGGGALYPFSNHMPFLTVFTIESVKIKMKCSKFHIYINSLHFF